MPWSILLAALPGFLIAWTATFFVRVRAKQWGLVSEPRADRFNDRLVPTGGGLAIWFGVVLTFACLQGFVWTGASNSAPIPESLVEHRSGFLEQSSKLWVLLAAATLMMLLGLWDDCMGLDWRLKLVVQTAIAAFTVWQGWRLTLFIEQPFVTWTLSVLWIVAIVNAFNLLDNMDGLASGVAVIAAVILAAVMLLAPDPQTSGPQLFVAGFLLVLAGSIGGFWMHNRTPAKIFMGDAGSYFVGFCLAAATLMATFAGGDLPRYAVFAPLCVLAVPLYDTVSVVTLRLREGRSPFAGDKNHFSHRLVQLGMSPQQAVRTIYLLTAACGLGALLLHQVNAWGAAVVLLMVAAMLCVIAVLEAAARTGK